MIKFIYFDVGGVQIKDFSSGDGWQQLKKKIGLPLARETAFDNFWNQITPEICKSCDIDNLRPQLEKDFGIKFTDQFSLLKTFVDLFEKQELVQDLLNNIFSQYETGLLTNMYPRMLEEIKRQNKLPTHEWQVVIDSSEVGLAKPEKAIFQLAQEKSGRAAEDILFVDNTHQHLTAAQKLGWQTFWFNSKEPENSWAQLIKKFDLAVEND